jgi:hypothetical protein
MDTALMVNALHSKGCKFMLTRNFKDLEATQNAVKTHHREVEAGTQRKIIVMAIQHDVLPDYTILVTAGYPNEREVERFGFYPVKKDRANWQSIQFRNRKGKEHLNSRDGDYDHTSNYNFLPLDEVQDYLKMAEKQEQIKLVYK